MKLLNNYQQIFEIEHTVLKWGQCEISDAHVVQDRSKIKVLFDAS